MMLDDAYTLRARRVAAMQPGRAVIENGAVLVRQGRIAEAGSWRELKARAMQDVRDMGEVTLLPGVVNAHAHLELSHLGLPEVQGQGYLAWVRWLISQPVADLDAQALARAVAQLTACGTAGVADITSRNAPLVARSLEAAGIRHVMQFERFGYLPDAPLPDIALEHLSLAGHALYSTSPESLRAAKQWDHARNRVFSIHLAEHAGEVELLANGTGDFADFMRLRILPRDFAPPGLTPVGWADALGLLDARTLAVHGVHVSQSDIDILKTQGVTVCLCPRSNEIIGVGRAPARAYLDAGIPCCLGTDSLASSPDLNLFGELRALLEHTGLSLAEAVRLLSANAAGLLGFSCLGSLAPGMAARFAVLPPDLESALDD
ncbi:MAG: amidohydrolase family protein [Acidobacteriota bacterium]